LHKILGKGKYLIWLREQGCRYLVATPALPAKKLQAYLETLMDAKVSEL
jgi:hypothetical protein